MAGLKGDKRQIIVVTKMSLTELIALYICPLQLTLSKFFFLNYGQKMYKNCQIIWISDFGVKI